MEAMDEQRVWQRVRGTGEKDMAEQLRECLAEQGRLWAAYRQLSRRGGKFRLLFEQKEQQISCLRGLLRLTTGQGAAHPRPGEVRVELLQCFAGEQKLLQELSRLSRAPDLGPVFNVMAEGQKKHLRLLLEIIGTM